MKCHMTITHTFLFLWHTLTSITSSETEFCSFSQSWDGFPENTTIKTRIKYFTEPHWISEMHRTATDNKAPTSFVEETIKGQLQIRGQAVGKQQKCQHFLKI